MTASARVVVGWAHPLPIFVIRSTILSGPERVEFRRVPRLDEAEPRTVGWREADQRIPARHLRIESGDDACRRMGVGVTVDGVKRVTESVAQPFEQSSAPVGSLGEQYEHCLVS